MPVENYLKRSGPCLCQFFPLFSFVRTSGQSDRFKTEKNILTRGSDSFKWISGILSKKSTNFHCSTSFELIYLLFKSVVIMSLIWLVKRWDVHNKQKFLYHTSTRMISSFLLRLPLIMIFLTMQWIKWGRGFSWLLCMSFNWLLLFFSYSASHCHTYEHTHIINEHYSH